MTPREFRRLALTFPEAVEFAHMAHPDFRVAKRIFATLGYPDRAWGMVKLTPEQQELFVRAEPKHFMPVKGNWGRRGNTSVRLAGASPRAVREALRFAWTNHAPRRLVDERTG